MAKASLKIGQKYRSYGSLDPLFLVPGETDKAERSALLARKAYRALHLAFVTLPILTGVDKFSGVLADWSVYVAPAFPQWLGVSAQQICYAAGVLEIFLGVGLLMRPRVFADLFGLWIAAITVNLLIQGEHFDVALFNFALAAGSCALARLSKAREKEIEGYFELPLDENQAA